MMEAATTDYMEDVPTQNHVLLRGNPMIKFKHIAVHEDTFKAFKQAVSIAEGGLKRNLSFDDFLRFLLMDFEACFHLPQPLRKQIADLNQDYWLKRWDEKGDPL